MSVSMQVLYPVTEETNFDHAYYKDTHLKLVDEYFGSHLERVLVTKGVAGGPGIPAGFHAIATMVFPDQDAMNAAMKEAAPVLADIPNFTNSTPTLLIGEVVD